MNSSRRELLASLAAAGFVQKTLRAQESAKGRTLPSAAVRYLDPATEFVIVRLTDPKYSSVLPDYGNRVLTSRGLLYASDESGRWEAYRMDLKNRESRRLTEAAALEVASLAFLPTEKGAPSERSFCHFDGAKLIETDTAHLRLREIYRVPDGFTKVPGVSYSSDGQYAAFAEQGQGKFRLRVLHLARGSANTLVESAGEIRNVRIRPRRNSVFYRLGDEARLIQFDGNGAKTLALPAEGTGQAEWSSDGSSLLYLTKPSEARRATVLRAFRPDTGEDSLVANTTQFVHFSANTDASVFAGASGSKASPYVLLLTRVAKRELTLAEHRSADIDIVTPVFAPNSQFVVFGSDRHGKPAIYWIAVDRFVSDTEDS